MAMPVATTPRTNPSHAILHQFHFNAKAYGAAGDGVADDSTAINSAIAAMDNGSAIIGTLHFPAGTYKTSAPIVIGDGSKFVGVTITGQAYNSGSNSPLSTVIIKPTNNNNDAIQYNAAPSQSSSLIIDGIIVQYASAGTGKAFNFAVGSQTTGPIVTNCTAHRAGVGFNISTSVNAKLSNCVAHSCTKGVVVSNANLTQFDNCYFQQCVTSGVSVESASYSTRFESCVFQSNTGPGLHINSSSSSLNRATFYSCWWEFPGTDMIRAEGPMSYCTFVGCLFDGSGNNRNVINVQAGAASSIFGRGLTFIGCYAVNLGTGKQLFTATDPTNSNDPGFQNIYIMGGQAQGLKGLHTTNSGLRMNFLASDNTAASLVDASSVYGIKAPYMEMGTLASNVLIRNDLGAAEFTEVSAPGAGAANTGRLYVEDNGAGKTRLVVKFNTGAAQVIATEP